MTLPYFQIDTRNERLKTLTHKHASLWEEFSQKLNISWIYHDHGLEGVVLQFQEISIALNNKVISDNSFLPMYQEIKNMNAGIRTFRDMLDGKKPRDRVTRSLLQQGYTVLSQKLRNLPEGDGLRQEDGRYGAYYHKSCSFTEIDVQLKKVLTEANQTSAEDLHPIVQATRLHFRLMKVMPYGRFSGKISRLVSNLLLMRHGYPPAIVHTVERARYYEALAQDDESQLLNLVIEGLTNTVESGLQYIEDGLAERRRKREARKAVKLQREQEKAAKVAKTAKAVRASKAVKASKANKASKPTPKVDAKSTKVVAKAADKPATKAPAKTAAKAPTKAAAKTAAKAAKPAAKATKAAPAKKTTKTKAAAKPAAKATKPAKAAAKAAKPAKPAAKTVKAKAKATKPAAKVTKATKATPKVAKATKTTKPAAKATKTTASRAKTKTTKPAAKPAGRAKPKASSTKKAATGTRQSAKKATKATPKASTTKSTSRKTSRAK